MSLFYKLGVFLFLSLSLFVCVFIRCVKFRLRIANRMVKGSYCREGIVHSRDVCSGALLERPKSPKGLWRFRVSTSNSRSGRAWPPTDKPICYIYHTYAQQDI